MMCSARAGRKLLPALLLGLLPTSAHAQKWTLDVAAGQAVSDPIFEQIGGATASMGLRYQGRAHWLYLSGGLDARQEGASWGTGGAGAWLGIERASLTLGTRLGAHLYGYGETERYFGGTGAILEAYPTLSLREGPVEVEVYSGVVQMATRSGTLSLARSAFDGGASAFLRPYPGIRLGAVGRYMHVAEGGRPYLGGTAELARGPVSAWAFAGRWYANDAIIAPYTGYGAGGSLALPGRVALSVGWQQDPGDPLFRNSPRRAWSVRVSRAFGRQPAPPAPAPVAPPEPADGRVVLRLPIAEHPRAPAVLGDFTGWEPVAMVRSGEFWEARISVAPGVYRYGFRATDGRWFVPASLPQGDDGMGGTSAVLIVPEA